VDSDEEILLTLNRPLQPEEGTLAVLLGATDLTALFEYEGSTLRYRPELILLPPGQSDITVYLVTAGQPWQEVARLPIHVRLPGGFEKASLDPALTLALLPSGVLSYRAPTWLHEKTAGGSLRWRVAALGPGGTALARTPWRELRASRD
jgi:hypothetical protein